jgi:hypothetical protein
MTYIIFKSNWGSNVSIFSDGKSRVPDYRIEIFEPGAGTGLFTLKERPCLEFYTAYNAFTIERRAWLLIMVTEYIWFAEEVDSP